MNVIEPSVDYLVENEDYREHVAKCASICYDSRNYNAEAMCNRLLKDGHNSMFRHASVYFKIPYHNPNVNVLLDYYVYYDIFGENPFVNIHKENGVVYMSMNYQYYIEHPRFKKMFGDCIISNTEFFKVCPNPDLFRFTFICVTSVKVSRELNRVSPNNIAEASTRYINLLSKQGGASACASHEPDYLTVADKSIIRDSIAKSCETYDNLIKSGIRPEDARRVLPFDTATKAAYTYTLREWKHILDLRYYEKTGKAAPDAKIIAGLILSKFVELGYIKEDEIIIPQLDNI